MIIEKVYFECKCGYSAEVKYSKKITCRCGSSIDLAYQSYPSHILKGISYLTSIGISKHLIDKVIAEHQFETEEFMIKYIVEYDNRTRKSESTN